MHVKFNHIILQACSGSLLLMSSSLSPHAGKLNAADETDGGVDAPSSAASGVAQGVAIFLWETFHSPMEENQFYFGLFDLNAWYQVSIPSQLFINQSIIKDQMPSRVELEGTGLRQCPYFSVCSLNDAVEAAQSGEERQQLLTIGVEMSTLSR